MTDKKDLYVIIIVLIVAIVAIFGLSISAVYASTKAVSKKVASEDLTGEAIKTIKSSGEKNYKTYSYKKQNTNKILYYYPMQCTAEPWNTWPHGRDAKELTKIKYYYKFVHGLPTNNLKDNRIQSIICEFCYICPKEVYYSAEFDQDDVEYALKIGWKDRRTWQ